MKSLLLTYYLAIVVLSTASSAWAEETAALESPDGRIKLTVAVEKIDGKSQLTYQIAFLDQPTIDRSAIRFARRDGTMIGDQLQVEQVSQVATHDDTWEPIYGENATIRDNYKQVTVKLRDTKAEMPMTVTFRCYDAGVAFQTTLGEGEGSIAFEKELTEFNFLGDHQAWCTEEAQGLYEVRTVSKLGEQVERPLIVKANENKYIAIAEAKLVDYARMRLQQSDSKPNGIVSQLHSGVKSSLPLTTPWRVVMVAKTPGKLLENKEILLNLNDPCALADTSWIKPGKVLRDITLSDPGARASIDFAVKNNFQFVEFDAGWYGNEYDNASDASTITVDPKRSPGLDLRSHIDYANERGIGVILYVNRRCLERQLDEILPLYKSWGVKGVKYGFVQVGSQKWTSWLHEAIRKAADHQLMIDVHDEYRSTGYTRTYPHFMTQEGVRGDEASPPSEQALVGMFANKLSGASDHTFCYFDGRVDRLWTHAHQLAKPICSYSPWQFLFWYDSPLQDRRDNVLRDVPEIEFWRQMPTVWDESKVLNGEIGKYLTVARRSGNEWFIGAMNAKEARTLKLPFDFLTAGKKYTAHIYSDDPSMDTPTKVAIGQQQVDATTVLDVELIVNGGQAIHLVPVSE